MCLEAFSSSAFAAAKKVAFFAEQYEQNPTIHCGSASFSCDEFWVFSSSDSSCADWRGLAPGIITVARSPCSPALLSCSCLVPQLGWWGREGADIAPEQLDGDVSLWCLTHMMGDMLGILASSWCALVYI